MKPPDVLGIIVRAGALFVITYGLWNIWWGIEDSAEALLRLAGGESSSSEGSPFLYFAGGLPAFAFGMLCFFGADFIVRLGYRKPPDEI
jgi:hypothetical protein